MTTARRNVLVVGPSWVGDMVMAQSLFQILCQQISDVQISVLAPKWSLPLLGRMPEVAAAIPTPFEHGRLSLRQRFKFAHQLHAKHFDQAIILPRSLKAALVPFLAGIPLRTGFLGEKRYGLLNDIRRINQAELPRTVQHFVQLGRPRYSTSENSPPRPRLVAAGVAGFECHLVRHHEGRVEPDTELANQFWVVLDLAFLECLHELPCTRTGNGADVGLEFIACHADAVVLDAEGFGLVVHVELYTKLRIVPYKFLVGQGLEAQPVDRIRSVADKLPQEDVLVRVE